MTTSTEIPAHRLRGPGDSAAARVPEPRSVEETGLDVDVLIALALKTMYYRGRATEGDLASWLGLSRAVIDPIAERMKRDLVIEAVAQAGLLQFRYALTESGRVRALEALERDQYVGPAPVAYDRYLELQSEQSIGDVDLSVAGVMGALSDLVLPVETIEAIGAGVVSAGALLLYGPSGNGKSTIANAIRGMLQEPMAVPYALEVGGRIMRVFDSGVHEELPGAHAVPHDRRFALCHRPLVALGTELTLADLEVHYSATDRTYTAPPQLKAAGGVLVVDDLGRQAILPAELLNRWMAPMATSVDQISLVSGERLRVPFDMLLVFATNLEPSDLGDEAFLRRIRHKVLISDPSRDDYLEIFERAAAVRGIAFDREPVEVILREYYEDTGRPLRGSHPDDLLQNITDFARVANTEPAVTLDSLRHACDAYFVHRSEGTQMLPKWG
jgi:predicted ATPase with chaperone activity